MNKYKICIKNYIFILNIYKKNHKIFNYTPKITQKLKAQDEWCIGF